MSCLGSLSNIVPSCCNPPDNGPHEWENGTGAERGPCKVMKVALGVLSLIAAAISGITMIATGNPLSLISTVTFGFAACYLLHSLGDNTVQHRSTHVFRNNIHANTPRITPQVISPIIIPQIIAAPHRRPPHNPFPRALTPEPPQQQNILQPPRDDERRIGVEDGNREPFAGANNLPIRPQLRAWTNIPLQIRPQEDQYPRVQVGQGDRVPPEAPPSIIPQRPFQTPTPPDFLRNAHREWRRPQVLTPIHIPQQNNAAARIQVGQGGRVDTPIAVPVPAQNSFTQAPNQLPNQLGNQLGNQPQPEQRRVPVGQGGSVLPQQDGEQQRIPIKRNK